MAHISNCQGEEATEALARQLASLLRGGEVLILEGGLGAGKTFFVRALARGLGLDESVAVTSPTFALVHEYPEAEPPLLHADLYRLGDPDELIYLGLEDRLGAGAGEDERWVAAIEWGEPFIEVLGGADLLFRLEATGETERRFTMEPLSARGRAILAELSPPTDGGEA